jgi:acetolactate synthase-1/3 small subunit
MESGINIITLMVEDRPGVLFKITSLIRRRGFNIETITVGRSEKEGLSRITMTMYGDTRIVEQIVKQLSKIPDVIKITELPPSGSVYRELALVKISAQDSTKRSDILNYISIFRSRVVDASLDSLVVELVGSPNKINAFLDLMKGFGILEIARTGTVALGRGAKLKTEPQEGSP